MMVSITTNKSVCRTENEVFIKRANTIVDYYAEKFILSLTADCPGVVKPVKYVDTLFEIHMPNYPRVLSASSIADLEPAELKDLIFQMFHTVHELHQCGIIHCDIKPANILLDDMGTEKGRRAVFIDFNMSVLITDVQLYSNVCSTQYFRAPEIDYSEDNETCHRQNFTSAIDVWSLGCTLYNVLFKEYIRGVDNEVDLEFGKGVLLEKKKGTKYAEFLDLIFDCLVFDAKKRPTCVELMDKYNMRETWSMYKCHYVPRCKWNLEMGVEFSELRESMGYLSDDEYVIFKHLYNVFLQCIQNNKLRAGIAIRILWQMYQIKMDTFA